MSTFTYQKKPEEINKMTVDTAEIKSAKIIKEAHKNGVDFLLVLFTFFLGAFSLAVALSFNSFAKSIIDSYGMPNNINSHFIYFLSVTIIALIFVWVAWKLFPDRVVDALS